MTDTMTAPPAPPPPPTGDAPAGDTDAAWVTVTTPYTRDALRPFLKDAERLLRINSAYIFEAWEKTAEDHFKVRLRNQSNKNILETVITVSRLDDDAISLSYADGLKRHTTFRLEDGDEGLANLVITDDYSGVSEEQREARIDEVDHSLVAWGHDLFRYLRAWKKWGKIRPWAWYMQRVWLPMRPMARRVTALIIAITILEFVAFLMVFMIFWLELDQYLDL